MDAMMALSPRRMEDAGRARLAERADTPPEMLFFLANDPATSVRAAIAANAATPALADQLLARDAETGVRRVLARKLAALAPLLDPEATERHRRIQWETLLQLVQDVAVPVRAAIADLVAEQPDVPRPLILRLAHDIAMAVAEPVIRGSPLLEEADLIWLVAKPPVPETLVAVARRPNLPEGPSDALAERADGPSVAALLANATARLREETLVAIADGCAAHKSWQAALVRRAGLSEVVLRRLSGLLAEEALRSLLARPDIDKGALGAATEGAAPPAAASGAMDEASFVAAARRGGVSDCARILAGLCGLPAGVVLRAIERREAPAIVSLCWKAGLSPSTAVFAQMRLAGSKAEELLIQPGGIWAMDKDLMRRHVERLLATA